jgi:hypothetical protein
MTKMKDLTKSGVKKTTQDLTNSKIKVKFRKYWKVIIQISKS